MAAATELTEGAKKVLDENEEYVCGFCSLQIVDGDGYIKKTKGSSIEAPFHIVSKPGDPTVILQAKFAQNPLFYLEVTNQEEHFLFGRWWMGDGKWSRTNQICTMIPLDCRGAHAAMEKTPDAFEGKAEMPFINDAPNKLITVKLTTKEQKYQTKLTSATVEVSRESFNEWKQYRLKLWRSSKTWAGEDKSEEKKEDGEGGEKGEE
eukprot:gnl/MRDRNA2_/MRDRNA2_29662_c0_seq1.p1 gnl/MRDRNA2_/MRDRNA2_29662_c0~~gnl/MRDRNA2_/MRDRNA2_29662_c0_seq1.p1  ORF type:complete len:206 (+),score=57.06 gnl/MRDRNA2_/MRDRNA2_29662_c0_seq1:88-705(+)